MKPDAFYKVRKARFFPTLLAALCITVLTASPAKAQTTVPQSASKLKTPRVPARVSVPKGVGTTDATAQTAPAVTAVKTITGPCPIIIRAPGMYSLGEDLPCSLEAPSIFIISSNVTLFLNGHTLSNTLSGGTCGDISEGIQVAPNSLPNTLANVSIVGPGTFTNLSAAITSFSTVHSSVYSIKVTDNAQCPLGTGVFIDEFSSNWTLSRVSVEATEEVNQGIGIFLAGSNSSILDCNIQQPTVDTGIMLGGSNNAVLGCSNITDSILVFSNENLIAFNNASSDGIGIGVFGNNNQIYVNTTKNNSGGDGIIVFSGALGNKISGNKSFDNTPFDMEDDNPGCGTNVWVGNKFNTANESCIH